MHHESVDLPFGRCPLGWHHNRGSIPCGAGDLCTEFRLPLDPTPPHIQWVPREVSLRVKQSECDPNHPHLFSTDIKNTWSYVCSPPYAFVAWRLINHWQLFRYVCLLNRSSGFVIKLVTRFLQYETLLVAMCQQWQQYKCVYSSSWKMWKGILVTGELLWSWWWTSSFRWSSQYSDSEHFSPVPERFCHMQSEHSSEWRTTHAMNAAIILLSA
jgi:hypothetical protein